MMDAVLELAGTRITVDRKDVILWPRAEEIARFDPGILRKKAMLGYRAERLVKAARYLAEHPVSLRNLACLPEEEAMKILTGIPGIGRYSAAIRLPFTYMKIARGRPFLLSYWVVTFSWFMFKENVARSLS